MFDNRGPWAKGASVATIALSAQRPGRAPRQRYALPLPAATEAVDEVVTRRIFWAFIALHILVWTVIPVLTEPNCPLDMVEMLYWGRGWQLGYYKHPPLPAWIAESLFQISWGATWPLFCAAQMGVATSFWAAWKLAKEYLAPWPALCASLLLEACVNYNVMSADLNNTIISQPFWALSALMLFRSLKTGAPGYWLGTGVCIGLGLLAKYDIAILVAAMLLLPVVNSEARSRWLTAGPWITIVSAAAIFAPHVVWLVQNDFPTINYAMNRGHNDRSWLGHVANPIEFLLSQLLFHVPMLFLTWPLWRTRPAPLLSSHDKLKRDFLLVICLGPLTIDLVLSVILGVKLQSMWGASMWTFSGLLLLAWAGAAADRTAMRRILPRCAAAGVILAAGLAARNVALPYVRAKASRVHFPGAQLAQTIESEWRRETAQPLSVVAGPWWLAASAGLQLAGRPEMYDFAHAWESPWSGDEQLRRSGGVIVWQAGWDDRTYLAEVRRRFPDAEILPPVSLRWQTSAAVPPVQFRFAMVRPKLLAQDDVKTGTRLR
jgi:4-amino-4-deoxy-L-arabinose transferase-like glycosyltransferase